MEAWDQQQKAVDEYYRVTTEISQNLNTIITSILQTTMEDLGVGPALRLLDATLGGAAREHIELGAMTPEQRKEYEDRLRAAGDKYWREHGVIDFLKHLWSDPDFIHKLVPPPPIPPMQSTRLMENYNDSAADLLLEEKRLTENIAFLNSLLSGETSGVGGGEASNRFGPAFHNRPGGGAEGESNPIKIPASAPQPGGGAAAEAREQPGNKPGITALPIPKTRPIGVDTILPGLGGTRTEKYGKNLSDPATREHFMALVNAETGGQGPIAQQGFIETILNRGMARGETLDQLMANKAYFPARTQRLAQSGLQPAERAVTDPLLGTALAGSNLTNFATGNASYDPKHQFGKEGLFGYGGAGGTTFIAGKPAEYFGQEKSDESWAETMRVLALGGGLNAAGSGSDSFAANEDAGQSIAFDRGRDQLDRQMAEELDVNGKLNVKVDAPAGTSVSATGGGMFENNVTLDRGLQPVM
jgi:hypothetical protein